MKMECAYEFCVNEGYSKCSECPSWVCIDHIVGITWCPICGKKLCSTCSLLHTSTTHEQMPRCDLCDYPVGDNAPRCGACDSALCPVCSDDMAWVEEADTYVCEPCFNKLLLGEKKGVKLW